MQYIYVKANGGQTKLQDLTAAPGLIFPVCGNTGEATSEKKVTGSLHIDHRFILLTHGLSFLECIQCELYLKWVMDTGMLCKI